MKLGEKTLSIPIIQGGMGVGVSLSSLAGHVALQGGMGVISSVNIGYLEPDFTKNPVEANLRALRKHIRKAKEISQGKGMVAVNIMTAVTHYAETVQVAIEEGIDAIISGAGLPLKLPEYVKGSKTLFAPIISSAKAAKLLCAKFEKEYKVIPDFFVIEGAKAGGHLGFKKEELLDKTYQTNEEILPEVLEAIKPFEERFNKNIPVFVAGGVYDGNDMSRVMDLGASGVQIATRFIATDECDADIKMKEAIVNADAENIRIIKSPVGMPARAVDSPLLRRLDKGETFGAEICNNCLNACPKGIKTPYCISRALIEAVKGNWEDGLFFCGENAEKVNEIVSVKELMDEIVSQWRASKCAE